jgi:hypothetical protein
MANPIVSGITGYVDQNREELLTKSYLASKSADLFRKMVDVKGKTALHLLDVDPIFQAGGCSFTESGSTAFTNRELDPAFIKVNMTFCDKELLGTYAEHRVNIAAGKEELPFAEKWTNTIAEAVAEKLEKMMYQGQSANTNEFGGLIETLSGESDVVEVSASTGETAYAFLKKVAKNIPARVKNPVILVSDQLYEEFMQDLVTANLFHYDPKNGANEYMLPGTSKKVIAVSGLNEADKDYAIAANLNNIVYGIDAEGDESSFDIWYSKDDQVWKLAINVLAGIQIGRPDEVVFAYRG